MTTTTPTVPAQRTAEPCAAHGIRHRPGTAAAIACAALSAAVPVTSAEGARTVGTPPSEVEVTVEHVVEALLTCAGAIRLLWLDHDVLVYAGALSFGEVLADRTDLLNLKDHLGSVEAVAADLTLAVQWEQTVRSTR